LGELEVEDVRKSVEKLVEDAVQFSLQSPQPSMDAAWRNLNCNRGHEVLM
jgi:TPP-dependent pyruvate/acetoin dehydrogenase alpha subunit